MRSLSFAALLALLVVLTGCERAADVMPGILSDDREVQPATANQLDSLAAEGARVSISGTVIEQEPGGRVMVDDGMGLVVIALPEEPPLLTGQRLLASGTLEERDGMLLLRASEWLYDSTAVPVHSD